MASSWKFDFVEIKGIQKIFVHQELACFAVAHPTKYSFTESTVNYEGDQKLMLSKVYYAAQCIVYNARWINSELQIML